MPVNEKIIINSINIDNINYSGLINMIQSAIDDKKQISIAYANANTLNLTYQDNKLTESLNSFDIIHPDGVGIYFASRFLYGTSGLTDRFTGSDFYSELSKRAAKNKWKMFFFGHDDETLSKIEKYTPELSISGLQNGYDFADSEIIKQINSTGSDILIIGLGTPLQENWVSTNKGKIRCRVIICVGDGIKVFSGDKTRGPKILRKLGLEWFARLAINPLKYFKRYVIGNPLFLYRIIILKMRKLA